MTKKLSLLLIAIISAISIKADIISVSNTNINPNQGVTISYKDMPAGSYLYIYQDAAPLPLKLYMANTDEENTLSGELTTGDLLPYKNTVRLQQGEDFENLQTIEQKTITVNEFPFVQQGTNKDDVTKIWVMNDLHVMAPELVINDGKALQDVVEGDRKMLRQSAEIFNALIDSILLHQPQLVLIPGDLTKDGEKVSHQLVAKQLQRLQDAGIQTFVIPGNHDVKNPHAKAFDGDNSIVAVDVLEEDFATIYKPFGYDIEKNKQDPNSLSYVAEPFQGLTIIAIDATRCRENKSTQHGDMQNSRQDYGRLRDATLQWVLARADEAKAKGNMIITMMHHQLLQHFTDQTTAFPSATIEQGDSIAQLFIEHGINVIFTGHMHITNNTTLYNETHTDSIVEISTGATVSYPVPYRMVTLYHKDGTLDMATRNLHSIGTQPDLQIYSRDELSARVDKLMVSVANMFSNEIDAMLQEVKNQTSSDQLMQTMVEKLESAMPPTNAERAALAYEYFGTPFTLAMLTASEGNEDRKLTELLDPMIYEGIDSLMEYVIVKGDFEHTPVTMFGYTVYMDTRDMVRAIGSYVKLVLQGKEDQVGGLLGSLGSFSSMTDKMKVYLHRAMKIKQSLLEDISYLDTENENKTDDLFLTLYFPAIKNITNQTPETPNTGVENINNTSLDNNYYDLLGRKITQPIEGHTYIHQGKVIMYKY